MTKFSFQDWSTKYQETRQQLADKYGEDFEMPGLKAPFGLNRAEERCIQEWERSLLPLILAIQKPGRKAMGIDDIVDIDEPYYGAIGGGLSYTFTPTGLGTIITVKEAITCKTLNVTEALDWYFFG